MSDVTDPTGAPGSQDSCNAPPFSDEERAELDRYRDAVEAAGIGIWESYPPDGAFHASPLAMRLHGADPTETHDAESAFAITHPDDRDRVREAVDRAMRDGGAFHVESRVIHPDGSVRWVADSGGVRPDANGVPRLVGVSRDITEARVASDRLAEREAQLRGALDAGRMGTWDWDLATETLRGTGITNIIFGLHGGETHRRGDYLARIHPDDMAKMEVAVAQALHTGTYVFDGRIRAVDGSWLHIVTRGELLRDEAGEPIRILGALMDVTERERLLALERAARERTELLQRLTSRLSVAKSVTEIAEILVNEGRAAFGAYAGGFAVTSDDGTALEFLRWYGYSSEETARWGRIPLDADLPLTIAARSRSALWLENTAEARVRFPALAAAGIPTGAWGAVPLAMGDELLGILALRFREPQLFSEGDRAFATTLATQCAQVLLRVRTEAALREAEERFRIALANAPIVVCTTDRELRYTWVYNLPAGMRPELVIGRRDDEILPAADAAESIAIKQEVIDREVGVRREITMRVGDDIHTYDISAEPLRDAQGKVVGVTVAAFDTTAQRRALMEAERANRTKTEFLRTMSHELRTPLNAIAGYVQLMEMGIRGPLTDEQRRDLERIGRSQRHLLSLIDEVLSFARIEIGHLEYHIGDVSLGELLDDVDDVVRPLAGYKDISLSLPRPTDDVLLRADADKLRQVLVNLIGNAIKFTPPFGRVTLEVTRDETMVQLHVIDTGPGIAREHHELIFEPFVQVGRDLNRPKEGTGLGLAISRELVHGMHGRLQLTSEPGHGARFTVVLPRR